MSGRNLASSQVSCPDVDRVKRIDVRVSPEEKAAIEASARAVGVSPAEFVRSRALEEGQVSCVTVDGPGRAADAAAVAEPVPPRAPVQKVPPAFVCPMHGCHFRAGSGKARCPHHARTVVAL